MIFEGFAASTTALALDPEQTAGSEDGSLEPTGLTTIMKLTAGDPEATVSSASTTKKDTAVTFWAERIFFLSYI